MINKPPGFKGLNVGIPIIIPIKGRGFINQGSTLFIVDSGPLPLFVLCVLKPWNEDVGRNYISILQVAWGVQKSGIPFWVVSILGLESNIFLEGAPLGSGRRARYRSDTNVSSH